MPVKSRPVNGDTGKYFYAVIAGSKDRIFDFTGVEGATVYTIAHGPLAAVVSSVPYKRIRPERRNFAAHQGVLRQLMQEKAVLPMSFGIISEGEKAVKNFLARNRAVLNRQVQRVANKVEMGLHVRWDVPNIFEYMTNIHGELRNARDMLLASGQAATQDERIELGRLFESLLNTDRDLYFERVAEILQPCCSELRRDKVRDEREIMNVACLIHKDHLDAFEAAVFEAAGDFDDNFAFDYNGPWAPHNFVDLNVDV